MRQRRRDVHSAGSARTSRAGPSHTPSRPVPDDFNANQPRMQERSSNTADRQQIAAARVVGEIGAGLHHSRWPSGFWATRRALHSPYPHPQPCPRGVEPTRRVWRFTEGSPRGRWAVSGNTM